MNDQLEELKRLHKLTINVLIFSTSIFSLGNLALSIKYIVIYFHQYKISYLIWSVIFLIVSVVFLKWRSKFIKEKHKNIDI